ncbi:MAG: AAA family ATPase [Verrucomicrobiota bacterium]
MTSPSSSLPSLIIVTGRPGSGKTTLSRRIAPIIHCPLIIRDDLKEGIVNTTGDKGEPAGPLTLEVYNLFFDTIESLIRHSVSLVAEAAFQHKNWAPELAMQRVQDRRQKDPRWDEFHNPPLDQTLQKPNHYEPPNLGVPILRVDTSESYQPPIEAIQEFVLN